MHEAYKHVDNAVGVDIIHDCLGYAVLLCFVRLFDLACLLLFSFISHLSLKHAFIIYTCMYKIRREH